MMLMAFRSTINVADARMLFSTIVLAIIVNVILPRCSYCKFLFEYKIFEKVSIFNGHVDEELMEHRRLGNADPMDEMNWQHQSKSLRSSVHCVGENFGSEAWMYRSCKFRNLCWDVNQSDYVVFLSPQEAKLQELQQTSSSTGSTLSSLLSREHSSVALGFMHPSLNPTEREELRWFPRVLSMNETFDYVMISSPTVIVPFSHSSSSNTTSLVWDTLIPIFSMLQIFGLDQSRTEILALQDQASRPLCAETNVACRKDFDQYSEIILGRGQQISSGKILTESFRKSQEKSVQFICASHAVAGMGMLSDRGWQSNNWRRLPSSSSRLPAQAQYTHNHAKGGLLLDFADFASQRLGLNADSVAKQDSIQIAYLYDDSMASSSIPKRTSEHLQRRLSTSFDLKQSVMEEFYPHIESLSVASQASKGRSAAICISVCGVGPLTALFLEPGSSLILVCDEITQGHFQEQWYWKTFTAHAAHLRIHWFESPRSPEALAELIESELKIMQ